MQKTNLVYFSPSGTTKSVISTLAEGLPGEKIEYDILQHPLETSLTFGSDEVAVFAFPVFAGRIPAVCADALQHIKGVNTPAIATVVYGNRAYDDALLELVDLLVSKGFVVVSAAAFVARHSIFPRVAQGRPDSEDKQFIAKFSHTSAQILSCFSGTESVAVAGNHPYREISSNPLKPSTNSTCTACGVCVALCPTKAIDEQNPRKTNKEKCISCTACIAACPQKARAFRGTSLCFCRTFFFAKM